MRPLKFFLFLFLLIETAHADRFFVEPSTSPDGDGSLWQSAYSYLQDALEQTESGRFDEVWVASGTYYPDMGETRKSCGL